MHENQCYACSYEFVEVEHEFGTEILAEAEEFIKEQPQIVRCKDCKYGVDAHDGLNQWVCNRPNTEDFYHDAEWFCADGQMVEDI